MKQTSASCLGVLLLLAAASGADDKPISSAHSHRVRLEDCEILLIDHVMLAADRTGVLKNVEFKEGQSVTKGSQVALIADDVAVATLAVAQKKASNEADVEGAKKMRDVAIKEVARILRVNKSTPGAISETEYDKAELAAEKAELTIKQAEHELEVHKRDRDVKRAELETYSIKAPFDGKINKISKKRGEAVKQGDVVAEIINTDRVRIKGQVQLADLRFAKEGAKVLVRLSFKDLYEPQEREKEVFEGVITFVDLVSDPIEKTTIVFAEVQNRDNILRAGFDAEMEILIDEQTAARSNRISN